MTDDEMARKERANRLRKQIDSLLGQPSDAGPAADEEAPKPETPREFTERKRREEESGRKDESK